MGKNQKRAKTGSHAAASASGCRKNNNELLDRAIFQNDKMLKTVQAEFEGLPALALRYPLFSEEMKTFQASLTAAVQQNGRYSLPLLPSRHDLSRTCPTSLSPLSLHHKKNVLQHMSSVSDLNHIGLNHMVKLYVYMVELGHVICSLTLSSGTHPPPYYLGVLLHPSINCCKEHLCCMRCVP